MAPAKSVPQQKTLPHLWRTLIFLLIVFILGNICFQAFNLVFSNIGEDVQAGSMAALITAIPGVVLGIVCFIYSSLGDFVSLKKLTAVGAVLLFVGSLMGFFLNFGCLPMVVLSRAIQTAGCQVTGSVFLVLASKYCHGKQKVVAFGVYTAGYQLSTAFGILAGGLFTNLTNLNLSFAGAELYGWSFLFLIPVLAAFCFPFIFPSLPGATQKKMHIDVIGFIIFGIAIGCLTIFFTCLGSSDPILHSTTFAWIIGAAIFFVVFGIYINKAKDPFITPEFLKNTRWLMSIGLFAIFYFFNFAVAPTFNALGAQVFGISTAQVSFMLGWGDLVAVIFALLSGQIDAMIGRRAAIIVAGLMMVVGFGLCAWFTNPDLIIEGTTQPWLLAVFNCFVWGGIGLVYSPVVDTVVSTVKPEESGRAIGSNDLILNVSGSIGVAIFGPMMVGAFWTAPSGTLSAEQLSIFANPLNVSAFSTLFWIYGGIALLGVIWFLLIKSKVTYRKVDRAEELGEAA